MSASRGTIRAVEPFLYFIEILTAFQKGLAGAFHLLRNGVLLAQVFN
jgi:hypothetical protein